MYRRICQLTSAFWCEMMLATGLTIGFVTPVFAQTWSLNGNSGTNNHNFLGTTDNTGLSIRTNNVTRMFLDPSGNFVFGRVSIVPRPWPLLSLQDQFLLYGTGFRFIGTGTRGLVDIHNDDRAATITKDLVINHTGPYGTLGQPTSPDNPDNTKGTGTGISLSVGGSEMASIEARYEAKDNGSLSFHTRSAGTVAEERMKITSNGRLEMFHPNGQVMLDMSGSEPIYGAGIINVKRDGNTPGVRISGRYPLPNTEYGGGIDVYGGNGAHNFELRGSYAGVNNGAWMTLNDNGSERITLAAINAGTNTGGLVEIKNRNGIAKVRLVGDTGNENGSVITSILQITGGSDLAEPFNCSDAETIKPGMVVAIDPDHPGHLRIADKPYDRTVAGIVSGANGINPGLTMKQEDTITDGSLLVSLTGRVYCWADATNGQIEPGDLLTTSNTPGYAMKVTDYPKAQGAIIGKAMSSLQKGKGLILVLVALQ